MRDMHNISHATVERATCKPRSTERPWAKIGTDLFQFQNKDYLVTIDYFSNFFEIDYLSTTTSNTVIKKLKGHMARILALAHTHIIFKTLYLLWFKHSDFNIGVL